MADIGLGVAAADGAVALGVDGVQVRAVLGVLHPGADPV